MNTQNNIESINHNKTEIEKPGGDYRTKNTIKIKTSWGTVNTGIEVVTEKNVTGLEDRSIRII